VEVIYTLQELLALKQLILLFLPVVLSNRNNSPGISVCPVSRFQHGLERGILETLF
jgi:hypothetical protein